jgi:hypothetical protein
MSIYQTSYSSNASMPPRGYKLLGAVALAGLIAALIVNNSAPPAAPKVEAAQVIAPVLPRIAAVVPVDAPAPVEPAPPKIVKTTIEVVAPPPAAEPAPEPAPAIEHRDRVADLDICARHGLHKIITRNGRGWRCR